MANLRQKRMESEHSAANSFVKNKQNELAKYAGKIPNLKPESMHFNSYMSNSGEHAEELARSMTSGLDKVAFPVK